MVFHPQPSPSSPPCYENLTSVFQLVKYREGNGSSLSPQLPSWGYNPPKRAGFQYFSPSPFPPATIPVADLNPSHPHSQGRNSVSGITGLESWEHNLPLLNCLIWFLTQSGKLRRPEATTTSSIAVVLELCLGRKGDHQDEELHSSS